MKISDVCKKNNKMFFELSGSHPAFANSLRRAIINQVPTMAIATVEIRKNSSVLYDEAIAHRLGMVIIKTDLKSYNLKVKCSCKGEGCAKCQLKLTLSKKGPGPVYASDLSSEDPKVVPVHEETIIAVLGKNQELELEATAILGKGKDHTKWSPGLAHYKYKPAVTIKKNVSNVKEVVKSCPKKLFTEKGNKLELVKDYQLSCHLCENCVDVSDNNIEVQGDPSSFIFEIEPWGQLDSKKMVSEAAKCLSETCDDFAESLKSI
jgi:DNA-directed RNA polymerase subunit D